jgi:hypothetical protein
MLVLAQAGVSTGYPDGAFLGRRALRRHDFARALQFVFSETVQMEGTGAPWKRHTRGPSPLLQLTEEFYPELAAQGVQPSALHDAVERFERLWRDPRPRGVTEPLLLPWRSRMVMPLWPPDEAARGEGAALAVAEWARGEVVLYAPGAEADTGFALPNAIRLRYVAEAERDPRALQLVAGHNREVWRRLRKYGPPPGSSLEWLPQVFHQRQLWLKAGRGKGKDGLHGESVSPDGEFRLHWNRVEYLNGSHELEDLEVLIGSIDSYCGYGNYVPGSLEWIWGPPGSGLVFYRHARKFGKRRRIRLYAVDLRTGCVLNVESVRH